MHYLATHHDSLKKWTNLGKVRKMAILGILIRVLQWRKCFPDQVMGNLRIL
jgi:hypothetical protein